MTTPRPPRQVCPLCGFDDVTVELVDESWVMTCLDQSHPPFEWRPTEHAATVGTYRSGIGQELGIYDDLLECVVGGMAEYGVIEHRYATQFPSTYKRIVDRYGHTALGPTRYSTSSFLGGALGQLWREGNVAGMWATATGYWSYNGRVGAYGTTTAVTQNNPEVLTWADFATDSLSVSPLDWPALDHIARP